LKAAPRCGLGIAGKLLRIALSDFIAGQGARTPVPGAHARRRRHPSSRLFVTLSLVAALPFGAIAQDLPVVAPQSVGLSLERLERVTQRIRGDVNDGKIPGAVMLVARHGKIAHFETLGVLDRKTGVPMVKDAVFRLASMTKPITIVGALTLIEEGRLRLNTPIAQVLPQFAHMQVGIENRNHDGLTLVPAERPISVLDLMRHTSGLTYEISGDALIKKMYREAGIGNIDESAEERVNKLATLPLICQPETAWEYGRSIDVLGRIIEVVSGTGLEEFLARRVLEPLGMKDTAFWVPPEKRDRIAALEPAPPGTPQPVLRDITRPQTAEGGGTGLVSTAGDYARFLQMLLNGGTLGGVRVLSRKTVEQMTTNQLDPSIKVEGPTYYPGPGYGYGLGFAVRLTEGLAAELGSVGDYHIEGRWNTFAFVDPKEDLVAVLMVQAVKWLDYRRTIKDVVLQSIVD
jgi:CubicO group peptidase (beta-lactamase class C family)